MLPLDVITSNNQVNNPNQLASELAQLKSIGTDGVMTDVWWGLVESGPNQYNWDGYLSLAQIVANAGLKLKVIMSFHRCGGNVGDTCNIPLPKWVMQTGQSNSDIFYTDREGNRDTECLSCGVDNVPVFSNNKTAVDLYSAFMQSFSNNFSKYLGDVITEVQIGLGPAGELRYPSYQLDKWSFPGVGEFQCYDKYLLAELRQAAINAGKSDWGNGGPSNAGNYNNAPGQTGFFGPNGYDNYASAYGQFFLGWYAGRLVQHGDDVLSQAHRTFSSYSNLTVAAKISGIHWLYKDPSHAAELTAGYKNDQNQGYTAITKMFAKYNVWMDFTCLEMRDSEQPASCLCGPEELVGQTLQAAKNAGIGYEGENALPRYDTSAYQQIQYESNRVMRIQGFDYLRLDSTLLSGGNWNNFISFVKQMHSI
jgi:beta-amylase